MTKEIKLTQGQTTLVDDEDFKFLNQFKWRAQKNDSSGYYAVRTVDRKAIIMHRLIMNCPDSKFIDHEDGDSLNNQKYNLRVCSNLENSKNKIKRITTYKGKTLNSQYKGVYLVSGVKENKWRAMIGANYKLIHLGVFKTEEEAALAYNEAARFHHGEFARLNIV